MPVNGGIMTNEHGNVGIKIDVKDKKAPALTVNGGQAVKRVMSTEDMTDTYIVACQGAVVVSPALLEIATEENPIILIFKDEMGAGSVITFGMQIDGGTVPDPYILAPYGCLKVYITNSAAFVISEK